jgi:hypothetical protein
MSKKIKKVAGSSTEDEKFPLPIYSKEDDIYNREKEESLDDDTPGMRRSGHRDKAPGEDLDIPGAELDDADEDIGEEDEENNYYSLGGENHEDLEDNQGD